MKTLRHFIFISFSLAYFTAFAQTSVTIKGTENPSFRHEKLSPQKLYHLKKLSQKLYGTYQVQIIHSRVIPTLEIQMMDTIQTYRQKVDTVYYQLNKNKRIMILPYDVINKPDFKKLNSMGDR